MRRPRPRATPNQCCILGIDAADVSGYGFAQPTKHKPLVYVGSCEAAEDRIEVVRSAMLNAQDLELPLVVVGEQWSRHGKWGRKQVAGTDAEWGKWEMAIELCGSYTLGRSIWPKIVRVDVDTWRRAVLGDASMDRELAKLMAMARMKLENPEHTGVLDHNAAEAGCVALWGRFASEVWAVLPKRSRGV